MNGDGGAESVSEAAAVTYFRAGVLVVGPEAADDSYGVNPGCIVDCFRWEISS